MKINTIGPSILPASLTLWALTATASSIATTKIANKITLSNSKNTPVVDTLGASKPPPVRKLTANSKPAICPSTLTHATVATANHFPNNKSDRAVGVQSKASIVPLSLSPAVKSIEGWIAAVVVHIATTSGMNIARPMAARSPPLATSASA